jgi:hypothetical protein
MEQSHKKCSMRTFCKWNNCDRAFVGRRWSGRIDAGLRAQQGIEIDGAVDKAAPSDYYAIVEST